MQEPAAERARVDGNSAGGPSPRDKPLDGATPPEAAAAARGGAALELDDEVDIWQTVEVNPAWSAWFRDQTEKTTEDTPQAAPQSEPALRRESQHKPAAAAAAAAAAAVTDVAANAMLRHTPASHPALRPLMPAFDAGARDFSFGATPDTAATRHTTLVSLLAVDERPRVPVELGRAAIKVPRVKRQAALDSFASRVLAAAARASGVSDETSFARDDVHRAARAAALSTAVKAEREVYAQSSSAMVYSNKAAQRLRELASASWTHASAEAPRKAKTRSSEQRDAMLLQCVTLRSDTCIQFFKEALDARALSLHLLWEPPFHWRRRAEPATIVKPPDAEALPPAGRPDREPEPAVETTGVEPEPRIIDAVRAYVHICVSERASDVLSPEAAARVVDRATAKVYARHSHARDASFLEREGTRIHELCAQYVRKEAAAVVAAMTAALK